MHIIFQNYDVIQEICAQLKSLRDLLDFSLTCRRFQEPALDRIWAELPSLVPLILVMPTNLWSVIPVDTPMAVPGYLDPMEEYEYRRQRDNGAVSALSFNRPLIRSDWTRFDWYGHRVKALTLRPMWYPISKEKFHIRETVWRRYASYIPARKLLPKLQSLTLTLEGDPLGADSFPFIYVLLHSGITRIVITRPYDPRTLEEDEESLLLSMVSAHCPQLKSLDYRNVLDLKPHPTMSLLLSTLSNLSHLRTDASLSGKAVSYLGELPGLRSLSLYVDKDRLAHFPPRFSATSFHRLRSLYIRAQSWLHAEGLLVRLPSRPYQLKKLHLESDNQNFPFHSGVKSLLLNVATLQPTILHLVLRLGTTCDRALEDKDTLLPLNDLSLLQSFELQSPFIPTLVDPLFSPQHCFWHNITRITLVEQGPHFLKLADVRCWFDDYPCLREVDIPLILKPFPLKGIAPSNNSVSSLSDRGLAYSFASERDEAFYTELVYCMGICFPSLRWIGKEQFGITNEEMKRTIKKLIPPVPQAQYYVDSATDCASGPTSNTFRLLY